MVPRPKTLLQTSLCMPCGLRLRVASHMYTGVVDLQSAGSQDRIQPEYPSPVFACLWPARSPAGGAGRSVRPFRDRKIRPSTPYDVRSGGHLVSHEICRPLVLHAQQTRYCFVLRDVPVGNTMAGAVRRHLVYAMNKGLRGGHRSWEIASSFCLQV